MQRTGIVAVLSCVAAAAARGQDAPPLNVLWIIAEDMGPELGCFGTPEVRTPKLDRLAAEGVRFTRAFATSPVCSTSRSAFMTGMYATSIGAHNHRSHRDDEWPLPHGVRVLTDWLRPAGWFTANIRRIEDADGRVVLRGTGKTDWNFTTTREPFDSADWNTLADHEPFFAQINFPETHRGGAWNRAHERLARPADPDRVDVPASYPDHPIVRRDWAQYLNAVMGLDRKVGIVLDRLAADGLADRTVVFFFADHGRAMVRGKQWCYDSGLHVPLIIRWPEGSPRPPGLGRAGTTNDRLVELIDLAPTVLSIASVPTPDMMQGRSLLRAEDAGRAYAFAARDRCDETVFHIRSVRDERYRYIRNGFPERPFLQTNRYKEHSYPVIRLLRELGAEGRLIGPPAALVSSSRPREELYDLATDPDEVVNLADVAEHAADLGRLRATLDEWIERTGDQGRTPEPPEIAAHWDRVMSDRYDGRARASVPGDAVVTFVEKDDAIEVRLDGRLFTSFVFVDVQKPYLYPLHTAGGAAVTRGFPMDPRPDEAHDHPHHTSLWFAHGDVNGHDFWHGPNGEHIVTTDGSTRVEGGTGIVEAVFLWKTGAGDVVCAEDRVMRFHGRAGSRVIDFDITMTATDGPLTFGDTKEGTFALRLAPTLRVDGPVAKGSYTSRTGRRDKACWGQRAGWVEASGPVAGRPVSVAIFDHPDNPRHPTWWHARPYGLFAANPFGVHDFEGGDAGAGDFVVPAGESVRFRYRVLIRDGVQSDDFTESAYAYAEFALR